MISELGRRPMLRDSSFGDDYEKEIGLNLYRLPAPQRLCLLATPEGFSAAEVGLVEEIKEMGLVVMMRSLGKKM
ncbi:hypothetical protein Bca52824_063911 [Brassica carinata]|uniref:Uncharacterized protein n=1 Tax=Brassica carinata TaxID=52824 RepID=A0A8X7U9M8_BRACI|nr:hypothetical protein Bca52824_063911 [Brassica carinata]